MSTIEEVRAQARETLADYHRVNAGGYGAGNHTYLAQALRALLDATEPSTVAVKTEFRVLDAPKDCDYHEGFEEGVKFGRAGSGPRPITDEMVAAADFAIMPYWGERYPSGSLTTEIARAALEAAEEARQ